MGRTLSRQVWVESGNAVPGMRFAIHTSQAFTPGNRAMIGNSRSEARNAAGPA
jgi:hypothetical protein